MGFLDDAKAKLEDLGQKAGDAFEAAKDKAGDVVDDVKDRLDVNNDGQFSVGEVFEAVKDKVSGEEAGQDVGEAAPTVTSPDIAPVDEAGASATAAGETLTVPPTTPVEPAADPLHPMEGSTVEESLGTEGDDLKY